MLMMTSSNHNVFAIIICVRDHSYRITETAIYIAPPSYFLFTHIEEVTQDGGSRQY